MKDGLLFANAVAKAKEDNLFTEERLFRMLEAPDLAAAVKILAEANYGGGLIVDDPLDFEKILDAEHSLLLEFLKSVNVKDAGFECFYIRADYHNIKAIVKARYQGESPDRMLTGGGMIPVSVLKEKLASEEPDINPYVNKALKEIKKAFDAQKSPRLIDTLIDRALFEDIAARLKSPSVDKYVKQYFTAYIDCVNIATFVRTARIGGKAGFFLSNFIEGGSLNSKKLGDMFPDAEKLKEYLLYSGYRSFADKLSESDLAAFDTARDNYLLNIFRDNRRDMFSAAPSLGYYLAKLNEIKVLRIVLVCIKNGVDRKEIKKRMRLLYA